MQLLWALAIKHVFQEDLRRSQTIKSEEEIATETYIEPRFLKSKKSDVHPPNTISHCLSSLGNMVSLVC